jgi:hypothetical protein
MSGGIPGASEERKPRTSVGCGQTPPTGTAHGRGCHRGGVTSPAAGTASGHLRGTVGDAAGGGRRRCPGFEGMLASGSRRKLLMVALVVGFRS